MKLTDDDIAAIALREIQRAQGYDSDVLATKRSSAIALYQGAAPAAPDDGVPEDEKTGRSGIVSLDVADSLHALLAQLGPVLKSSLLEFPPESQDDVAQAQMESDVVRRVIERSDGYGCLQASTHDALLTANGWLFLEMREYEATQTRRLSPDTPPEALADLPEGASLENTGDALVVSITKKARRLAIESVAPEEMLFSDEPGIEDLQQLRLVARRRYYTQAALLSMGVSREDAEQIPDAVINTEGERARQGPYDDSTQQSVQDATRLKMVYVAWLLLDVSDDGRKTERRELWIGGNKLLFNHDADVVPFVTGSGIPMPHRVQGMGLGELLASIQLGKTQIVRDYVDNLGALNASRVGALEGEVNMNDLTSGRVNGVVRMKRPDAVLPLPSADIGPQALAGLEYMDKVRGQRVGAALDQSEIQAQLMSASATAAAGQLAQVEMMSGWFAANLANTMLRGLYLLAHRMLRASDDPVMAQLGGQWLQVMPRDWPERSIVQVTTGLTTAQRATRQVALQGVIAQQQQALQSGLGGQLTDVKRLYNAMCDWLRAGDLADPDQYLIDPASPQAQQAAAAQQQAQQQSQAQAVQLQKELLQIQQQFELEKQARELEYKRWSDQLKAEVEEAKATASATLDALRLNHEKERANRDDLQARRERLAKLRDAAEGDEAGQEASEA